MVKHNGINVIYYDGYILKFDKVNVHAITLHMLVFSKNGNNLIVLHYNEYHKDDCFSSFSYLELLLLNILILSILIKYQ